MKEALSETPKPADKLDASCGDAQKSDTVWRGTMHVLAAYGNTLSNVSQGGDEKSAGKLEAALTGMEGTGWAEPGGGDESAAVDAAAALLDQMSSDQEDGSFEARVKAAAPHVRSICDGLEPYLENQVTAFEEIQTDLEAKKKTPLARRCAMMNNQPLCVSDNMVDRMVYADAYGRLATLSASHDTAHRSVVAFCAAHAKLAEAVEAGTGDEEAYEQVVTAVRDAVGSGSSGGGSSSSDDAAAGDAPPSE